MINRLGALNLSASIRHKKLVEEVEDSIDKCWTGEALRVAAVKNIFSNGNPKYSHTSSELHQLLHGGTLAMAVKSGLQLVH